MGQWPNMTCLAGASLVIASVVGIALEEKMNSETDCPPPRDTDSM